MNKHPISAEDVHSALKDASDGLAVADEGFEFLGAVMDALYDLRLDKESDNPRHTTRKAHSLIRLGHYVATMWRGSNEGYEERANATLAALRSQGIPD